MSDETASLKGKILQLKISLRAAISREDEANRDWSSATHVWIKQRAEFRQQVEQLQALLDIAICPNTPGCDGEGNIAVEGPVMNEFSAEHCQWCHEAGRCCIPAQQQEPTK